MTDTPQPPQDRPLVTFALFAYNQEKYIREAVEGAFSQTYEPLEIILSDDCSSDQTYQIMQKMAAAYEGPHTVIVRRNEINLMTALHVQAVAIGMAGQILVVAAGDDISFPHRVSSIISHWMEQGGSAVMLHSEADEFFHDDRTAIRSRPRCRLDAHLVDLKWYILNQRNPTLAPTAAYSRELFSNFPPLVGGSVIEDAPLFMRAVLSGVVQLIPDTLVLLRNSEESAGRGFTINNINRWNQTLRSRMVSEFNQIQDISYARCITESQKRLLKSKRQKQIKGLGKCVLSEVYGQSILRKLQAVFMITFTYPRKDLIYLKFADGLLFAQLIEIETLRNLKNKIMRLKSIFSSFFR